MNALPAFPTLPGISWPVKRSPIGGMTRSVKTVSGRMARVALWKNPMFDFELTFEALSSSSQYHVGVGAQSKQNLEGFFLAQQGSYGVFVFQDQDDTYANGAPLGSGTGDGTTTTFTAQRPMGAYYTGPADYILNVATVYVNHVAVSPTTWTLVLPNQIQFTSAPANGAILTMDYWFGYTVTFAEDQNSFEEFMRYLWTVRSLKLRGVRLS